MKISIRTRFMLGMIFFFIVIAGLSILSALQMNALSSKTDAMVKENQYSVIFAHEMGEYLTTLNTEMTRSVLNDDNQDSTLIRKTTESFNQSLRSEKSNITEIGEDKLVATIESGFREYIASISGFKKSTQSKDKYALLQNQFHSLYQQAMLLSQMNEQAIFLKAEGIKKSAEKGSTYITILGTILFLITMSFTFSFSTYFNERFSKLYNGIKEIGAGNYKQRLHFEGEDEFSDISLVFNNMAVNLNENKTNSATNETEANEHENTRNQVQELKRIIDEMHGVENRAIEIITKLETKNVFPQIGITK